ncbi:hypothetical protein D3C80_745840 [compost metagenome]
MRVIARGVQQLRHVIQRRFHVFLPELSQPGKNTVGIVDAGHGGDIDVFSATNPALHHDHRLIDQAAQNPRDDQAWGIFNKLHLRDHRLQQREEQRFIRLGSLLAVGRHQKSGVGVVQCNVDHEGIEAR